MSSGKHLVDPALSTQHIDQSIQALLKRVTVDRHYWIPYLAGYSVEWHDHPTVFIDSRLPEKVLYRGQSIDVTRYLVIHECVEKCLMDGLALPYELAHNLATAAERTAVEADGLRWDAYTEGLKPYIRLALHKPPDLASPANLDKRPYTQDKASCLDRMT